MSKRLNEIFDYFLKYHDDNNDYKCEKLDKQTIIKNIMTLKSSVKIIIMACIYIEKIQKVNIYSTLWPLCILCSKIHHDRFYILDHLDTPESFIDYLNFEEKFINDIKWETYISSDVYLRYKNLLIK